MKCLPIAALIAGVLGEAFAQGLLTPPSGDPAPSMKTLGQIEPRTPISVYNQLLEGGGSYYLTGNLYVPDGCVGIAFASGNVTLDLNGFAIIYVGESGNEDLNGVSGPSSITVRNGRILNFSGRGIALGDGAVVEDVLVENCAAGGISVGEQSRISRSRVSGCAGVIGIQAGGNSVVESVLVAACEVGVYLSSGCQIRKSTVSLNTLYGISALSRCVIAENSCTENGTGGTSAGILAIGNECRIEKNSLDLGAVGLRLVGYKNYVNDNTVRGNTVNYVIFGQENQLNLLISEIPQSLDWPCSARLAGTLACKLPGENGITVNADDVTIDLAGHALVGPGSSSGHGIYQNATNRNLRVANGKALNWLGSMKAGVFAGGSATVLTGLQVSTNYYGVFTGSGSSLSACAAQGNRSIGLFVSGASTLTGCTAIDNGDTGIFSYPGCSLTGCTAVQNGNNGISGSGCALASCTATYNHGDGIVAGDGGVLSGCSTYMNDGNGIHVLSGCLVTRCSADHNGFGGTNDGAGIYASSTQNRIEDNLVTYNDRGIDVDGTANFIARNSARGNTVNWDVVAGNVCLVIKATATTGAITGDSGGVAPGSTDPNANFTH